MPADPLAIVNPVANRGRAASAWEQMRPHLRRHGFHADTVRTAGPGDAVRLAEAAARAGRPTVLAVGGDGTVHEVANGLLRAAEGAETLPLAVVPAGSGNDFVKTAGILTEPAEWARRVAAGTVRMLDAGHVNGTFFVNGVGIGFDARVGLEARRVRLLRGPAVYAWALVKVLRTHQTPHVRVWVDGVQVADGAATLVTVANGGCCGGGFWLCPAARPDDGRLDVLVAAPLSRRETVRLALQSRSGAHVASPAAAFHRGREIRITANEPLPVHVDGEPLEPRPQELRFQVLPGRLSLLG